MVELVFRTDGVNAANSMQVKVYWSISFFGRIIVNLVNHYLLIAFIFVDNVHFIHDNCYH